MWENEQNNPYVARPGSSERSSDRPVYTGDAGANPMARAAYTIGIISVVSIFTMLIYPAIILGATAIILALLSRDREGRMHSKAKAAMTSGIVAIAADAVILVMAVSVFFSDGPAKQQVNDIFRQMYGQTFDDMIEDIKDGSLDLEYQNLPYSGLINDNKMSYNVSSNTV